MSIRKTSFLGLISAFLTGVSLGGAIPNWPAPASWTPPRSHGVTTLGDITSPLPFIGVTPCRVADTRGNGFGGAYGPPSLAANAARTFAIVGACGIPSGAAAVSFNFGALNVGGTGDLRVFPAGGAVPLASTLNYNANTPNIANAAAVPLGTGGAITVQADNVSIDLIIDVNGYYSDGALGALAPGERLTLVGDVVGESTGLLSVHNTESVLGARAGYFVADSPGFGSTGVAGIETATTGLTAGVYGQANSTTDKTAGLSGVATSTTGVVYGVYGQSNNGSGVGAAGVCGVLDSDPFLNSPAAGVHAGSTFSYGVFGASRFIGIAGALLDTAGVVQSAGYLGYSPTVGVHFQNGLAGTGTKSFVEPHPTDASKVIRYVSLEGPEAGTYFRGRGRFERGIATIELPDSFRMVTDPESLSIQVTPIGEITGVAVVRIGMDGIVVKGSRDVQFFYTVNGVRRAYNHWDPIQENEKFFVPESPEAKLPKYLSEEERGRLIANGTYNPDGTVNMDTAERVGWTKAWRDRENQARAVAANVGQPMK